MSEFKPGQKNMNIFGGFAFPLNVDPLNAIDYGGMTLRDYFAAKAMEAVMLDYSPESGALEAYKWADAMLKERSK